MVDAATAMRVAAHELSLAPRVAEGSYGDEKRETYLDRGLRGIVVMTWERGSNMWVQDVITQELFCVPLKLWGKANWINWKDKRPAEMNTFLYTKENKSLLMQPLPL